MNNLVASSCLNNSVDRVALQSAMLLQILLTTLRDKFINDQQDLPHHQEALFLRLLTLSSKEEEEEVDTTLAA
jgi:hypothetical protein